MRVKTRIKGYLSTYNREGNLLDQQTVKETVLVESKFKQVIKSKTIWVSIAQIIFNFLLLLLIPSDGLPKHIIIFCAGVAFSDMINKILEILRNCGD